MAIGLVAVAACVEIAEQGLSVPSVNDQLPLILAPSKQRLPLLFVDAWEQ